MIPQLVGRKEEIQILQKLYRSNRSEFAALYGRRRVGKTYLIKELFKEQFTFQVTGLSRPDFQLQLNNFYIALGRFDPSVKTQAKPTNWLDAFELLIAYLEKSAVARKVVFIDELPWMDTPKSDFISALEHFWNAWAYYRNDVLLIVCGSATSWMINELINNHGGLHNRVTKRLSLSPFTLQETEEFLRQKGSVYDRYQIVQLYMAVGGIPFYLDQIDPSKSIPQNIDALFFKLNGELRSEFTNLYRSLFKKHERHVQVIEALATKAKGLDRKSITKLTGLSSGGTLSKILKELEECGFIKKYLPFGKKRRSSLYQLTDPYSLFYLRFVQNSKAFGEGSWMAQLDLPKWRAWSGYAFEYICFYHLPAIKKALGISGIYVETSSWKSQTAKNGAQIDLVLDRRDRVISICEIKFSQDTFTINKAYAANLKNKITTFRQETKTKKSIFLTFITTFGISQNQYAMGLVQSSLTLEDLFN